MRCHHAITDVRDNDKQTPLHFACEGGSKKVVQYLVEEAKCDVGESVLCIVHAWVNRNVDNL